MLNQTCSKVDVIDMPACLTKLTLPGPHDHACAGHAGQHTQASPPGVACKVREVTSPYEAMAWATHGIDTLVQGGVLTISQVLDLLSDRTISTSSAFSGVESPAVGDDSISGTANKLLSNYRHHSVQQQLGSGALQEIPTPICFPKQWAFEYDSKCIQEIRAMECPPQHLFGDIMELTADTHRKKCGLDGGSEWSAEHLRHTIPFSDVKTTAWCLLCERYCKLESTAVHRAGSPCGDHSSYGGQERFSGKRAKCFYTWVALMRKLRPKIIFHENVVQFGAAEMQELLGDLYVVTRIVMSAEEQGWASVRVRQICYMVLKEFVYPMIDGPATTPQEVERAFDLKNSMVQIFNRKVNFHWRDYCISTPGEVEEELDHLRARKLVQASPVIHCLHIHSRVEYIIHSCIPCSVRAGKPQEAFTSILTYYVLLQVVFDLLCCTPHDFNCLEAQGSSELGIVHHDASCMLHHDIMASSVQLQVQLQFKSSSKAFSNYEE
jgi:hypothetical protein